MVELRFAPPRQRHDLPAERVGYVTDVTEQMIAEEGLHEFKMVNDSLGHAIGDELIRAAGGRVAMAVRTHDLPVRLGGDEFAVLLTGGQAAAKAQSVAERLLAPITEPFAILGTEIALSASVGIAAEKGKGEA